MNIENKNILILGLGVSGVASAKALNKLKANITINDSKAKEELEKHIEELNNIDIRYCLGVNNINLDNIDLIVKSPGIKNSVPIIQDAIKKDIEVITDIELGYRLFKNKIIAITGTNGKTTATTLVGRIFKDAGINAHISGNIGIGILWELVNSKKEDIFIIEASSFQLENTYDFKPNISTIINLKSDHLDWHGNYENYKNAKMKIFKNQDENDFTILNYDDLEVRELEKQIKSKTVFFSGREKLKNGIFIDCNNIVYSDGFKNINIIKLDDIKIPGKHNIENIMTAIGIALAFDIDINSIRKTISEFEGVEHRLEFVDEIENVRYYNDSKGTNIAASIQAIKSLDGPIILIAGGYDKNSTYDEFIEAFDGKISALILLGQTASKIKKSAEKYDIKNIYIVNNMKEAVNKAYSLAGYKSNVLLSPASASWGMYNNYAERGDDFKNRVKNLRRNLNDQKS
ncbi:MAG: UDP-N-acetylmuramoyl-L-alanine--D-glutamate ligase [Senegalia sp. (in: firmicutes)]|uniref:UDP-N-acetylmuramoyl-L-alanine--D-glutamate ligase n=1 Tax=Senegalia sp. (in: firmicutes) TaxID=1924098 RepID=UPI003F995364